MRGRPSSMTIATAAAPTVESATVAMIRAPDVVDYGPTMTDPPPDPRSVSVATAPGSTPLPSAELPSEPSADSGRVWLRRSLWVVAAALAVILVLGGIGSVVAWSSWRDVERVQLSAAMKPSILGTNYLIVGTDSREGITADQPNAGAIIGTPVSGERTDSIAVLHLGDGGPRLLAIPRDLYLPLYGGSTNRINAAFYFGGPEALVRTVQTELGIGIDHYLQIDLSGFLDLVDALGGVTIDIPNPAYDLNSGLHIETSGPVLLDGDTALAYVRSRHYVEIIDGIEVRDPTSDLGRVQRQQHFLAAVFAGMGHTFNPMKIMGVVRGATSNVKVDDAMSLGDAARLAMALRGLDPATATLPTSPYTTGSGAQVLLLREDEAAAMLADFR